MARERRGLVKALAFGAVLACAAALRSAADATIDAPAALSLYLVEAPGCPYCILWDREVGPAYAALATRGETPPLVRVRFHDPWPAPLRAAAPPIRITPTFVLARGDAEIGRIEGYPGADFFWPMLDDLVAQAAGGTRAPDPSR